MSFTAALLRRTALPFLLRREGRESALRHWRELEASQYWPLQRLLDYQWQRLTALLRHAYDTTPYYRRIFQERGLTPESIKAPDDLRKLPVLTREMVRDFTEELFSSRIERSQLQRFSTGGTTRQFVAYYRDQESFNIKAGAAWRFEGFMGRKPGDKLLHVWPVHIDMNPHDRLRTRIKNRYLSRELMFYVGAASEELLERYYRTMCSFRPEYLKVFPNALDRFADYLRAKGSAAPPVKAIFATGETLHEYHREKFREVFGAPTFNMYGSREVGNTACECEAHEGLHVAMETSFVETVVGGQPAPEGVEGEILITDLTNYGFPLIRYAIEDHGGWSPGMCSCGRSLPRMSHGVGRLCDQYVMPDGSRNSLHAVSSMIAEHGPPVGPIQFIQKSLLHFHLKVTDEPPITEELRQHIRKVMYELISPEIEITIEPVRELPREKSGKIRYCICLVDERVRSSRSDSD